MHHFEILLSNTFAGKFMVVDTNDHSVWDDDLDFLEATETLSEYEQAYAEVEEDPYEDLYWTGNGANDPSGRFVRER